MSQSALPYVDSELDALPGMRALVDGLVEAEMRAMGAPPQGAYLSRFGDVAAQSFKRTQLMQSEMERVAHGHRLKFDTTNYDMPQPSADDRGNIDAWKVSIANARAQLEHQNNRITNLELLTQYGGQAWTRHLAELAKMEAEMRRQLDETQARVENINWERQQEQTAAGQDLYGLELRWGELISKNFELEIACKQLEAQANALDDAKTSA